jgi:hypothetical protein
MSEAAAARITKPGLVYGMDDETYHADPVPGGSLSSTFARLLTNHVPAKADAIRRNRKLTAALNVGKAAHRHALGVGPELVVYEHDGRTKAGKAERAEWAPKIATEAAIAVTMAERDQIRGMRDALLAHTEVQIIFATSKREVSGFWQEGRTWCRARYDLLNDLAWDYKTTEDASARGFEVAMAAYGYHQQAEFYQRGARALGHPAGKHPMRFICQEKREPYLVQIHTCDDLAIEIGRELNDRAIALYAECKRAGEWPGYDSLHAEPTELPNYYFFRHEAVIPSNLNPFTDEVA